jgi:hypothetical protein
MVGRFLPGMDTCRQSIRRNAWPFSICGRRLLCKRNVWPVIFFWMFPLLMRYVGVTITKAEETCVYCANNERENMLFLRTLSHLLLSSLADSGGDWTEQEERLMLEI